MANKRKDFDLYFNGKIIVFTNGQSILQREKINYSSSEPDLYHSVIEGETLTAIAWKHYQKFTTKNRAMRYWKYIADVNNIMNPLDITDLVGSDIIIPNFNLCKLSE